MYRTFFSLKEKPFNLTPDPKYLYLNDNHREVLASLRYGIGEKRGFIVITGEVGTGKTTHLFNFLEGLGEQTVSAFIFNPILNREEFFQYIFEDFGIAHEARTKTEYLVGLNRFLLEQADQGVTAVLVIDEAQNLSDDILEEVRLLSNLETPREKLLQIVLVGQPELDEKLLSPSLRQLRQRISIRGRIKPLSEKETGAFIRHRFQVAGYDGKREVFGADVVSLIAGLSGGIPRVVNNICDNVLLSCYALGRRTADRQTVLEVAADLDLVPSTEVPPPAPVAIADDDLDDVDVVDDAPGSPELARKLAPAEDGTDWSLRRSRQAQQGHVPAAAGDDRVVGAEVVDGPEPSGSWERSLKVFQSFIERLKLEND